MEISSFVQLLSAYTGFVAALFFAFGVAIQDVKVMLDMSQSYFGPNPSTAKSLSQQKADYQIGVAGLLVTFGLQALAFLTPAKSEMIGGLSAKGWALTLLLMFIAIFFVLRQLSTRLAAGYERQIHSLFSKQEADLKSTASEQAS